MITLRRHLLGECDKRDLMHECERCHEIVDIKHEGCEIVEGHRCPLCFLKIDEKEMKAHLVSTCTKSQGKLKAATVVP